MANPLARFRQSGSFIAGLLIGLSIVVTTFAVTDADASAWQTFLVFGAPVIVVLGLALQVLVTAKPRRRLATSTPPFAAADRNLSTHGRDHEPLRRKLDCDTCR